MTVSVLIPYRPDPTGHRAAALAHVERWWAEQHPSWQVLRGACQDGPWVKAAAVAAALCRAEGDVLVVADADVIPPGAGSVVELVARGGAGWAMPHQRVHRLTEATTALIVRGAALPDPALSPGRGVRTPPTSRPVEQLHTGVAGGGCVVLPRALYERAPLDPRFAGWGQEDASWGRALTVLAGPPWRQPEPLWHLWHPPARRLSPGERPGPDEYTRLSRSVGSVEGRDLWRRYRAASTVEAITTILGEFPRFAC